MGRQEKYIQAGSGTVSSSLWKGSHSFMIWTAWLRLELHCCSSRKKRLKNQNSSQNFCTGSSKRILTIMMFTRESMSDLRVGKRNGRVRVLRGWAWAWQDWHTHTHAPFFRPLRAANFDFLFSSSRFRETAFTAETPPGCIFPLFFPWLECSARSLFLTCRVDEIMWRLCYKMTWRLWHVT